MYDLMATQRTILNDPELTPAQKGFLWTCTLRADNKTGKVRDSQENLAHYSRVNFKTVSNWINNFPAVNKYFRTKKRGRMLDLWFINVNLEVSLYDTRPSKIREELDNTPSEMEYPEENGANTPSDMEYQTVANSSQSVTPSEIPNTPSEIPNTPSEMEPSTCSSTVSSTDDAPAALVDSSLLDSKEDGLNDVVDTPLIEVSESPFVLSEEVPLNDVEDSPLTDKEEDAAVDVETDEIDWDAFDAFADYTPEVDDTQKRKEDAVADFGKWFDGLEDGIVKDVASFGVVHRKFHGTEKIKAVALQATDEKYEWCGNNVSLRYTYAVMDLGDIADSNELVSTTTDDDEW